MMTNKEAHAAEAALGSLRMPDSDEQLMQAMEEVDVFKEVLRTVPDDATVHVTFQDKVVPVRATKKNLMWSDQMLLVRSAEPRVVTRASHASGSRGSVTRVHATLIPTDKISSITVRYDVDTNDLLATADAEAPSAKAFESADLELCLDEDEFESLFGASSPSTAPVSCHVPSTSTPAFPSHGSAASSYDRDGNFVNCFQFRNMSPREHDRTYGCYEPCSSYRWQWEPYVGSVVLCEGTLTSVTPCGSHVRLTLNHAQIVGEYLGRPSMMKMDGSDFRSLSSRIMQSQAPVDNLSLFVSSDYEAPEIGSIIQARGRVYAYPLMSKSEPRRQLGLVTQMVREKANNRGGSD